MKHLKNIDVAFLQMNLPYTRTPDRIAGATKTFRPKIDALVKSHAAVLS